ncbi:hypothetical protein EDD29_6425 [Actinocorallia herbida]|uniref:Uncharacterized protein n=1 Tax=Actinocorallia herbida TaxID=58109 RepID=A0A3N1D5K8_9ACTN|nr:hypothetical protein [Actinocorallia herbida]ROO88746.1 hypothetical protein EDD29_6425 [Actinocorallia herbida]
MSAERDTVRVNLLLPLMRMLEVVGVESHLDLSTDADPFLSAGRPSSAVRVLVRVESGPDGFVFLVRDAVCPCEDLRALLGLLVWETSAAAAANAYVRREGGS